MEPFSICGGRLEEQEVEVVKKSDENVVVIKETPAMVCIQCGERYYSADTVKKIEKIINEAREHEIELHKIFAGEISFSKSAITG